MYGTVKCLPVSRRKSISDSSPSQSRLLTSTAPPAPARSRGSARAGPGSPRRWPRASRGRAGCARSSAPTDRRSSRSRRRPGRPAGRRSAAAGAGRRSGPGGRRGATSAGRVEADVAGDRAARGQPGRQAGRGRVQDAAPLEIREEPARAVGGRRRRADVTASDVEASRPSGRRSSVRSRPLCYRAATDADQPRAAPAPPKGAPGPPQGTWWLDHRSSRPRPLPPLRRRTSC